MAAADPNENTHAGLLLKLECDAEAGPGQLDLVDRCCRYYATKEVICDGDALPLHQHCPAHADCWARFAGAYPREGEGAISVPWIGPDYFEHRLCAVGINQNFYGGLGALWWITRGAIDELEAGSTGSRQFHLQAGYYLAVLLAALDRRPVPDQDALDPATAARAWKRCAFLEAVKCAPRGNASQPGNEMWRNCPPRFLQRELEILAPRRLLAIGRKTWEAVKQAVGPIEGLDYGNRPGFWRGLSNLGGSGDELEIFFVNHPGRQNWRRAVPQLSDSLRKSVPQ